MNPEILPFISERLGIPESRLTPLARLSDLNVQSLDMIELVFALEDEFGIEIPFDPNAKFETIGDLMEAVKGTHGIVEHA